MSCLCDRTDPVLRGSTCERMLMMAEDEATRGVRTLLQRHSRLMLTKTHKTSNDNSFVETPGGGAGSSPRLSNAGDRNPRQRYRTEAVPSYSGRGVRTGRRRG